jgi:N-acetylglucosaminyldiphosphoundecaprenol N-acetyl-beta-D-mannosaminyltransferase
MTPKKQVISLDISLISYKDALTHITELAGTKSPSYASFANAHMTVEAHLSSAYAKKVNQSTFTFADGMPLVFALRLLFGIRQERIAGMDFMLDMLRECEANRLSVFFFGSTQEVLDSIKKYVLTHFPQLQIAGMISPPFRAIGEEENQQFRNEINSSGANLVFVGLGCPKQETWMAKNSAEINSCLLGVGGAFEIYAGLTKRAPQWIRNIGMEWFFRFLQEPKRLFKRYAVTNTQFVYLFFKQLFSR